MQSIGGFIRVAAVIAFAFLMMAASLQAAPAATDEIQGTVKDALGRPLSGVNLTIKTPDEKVAGKAQSDVDGHFVFSGVEPGVYAVFGEKTGFQESTAIVTKEAGSAASAALTLTSKEALEVSVTAQRLSQARNSLSPKTGGSEYAITENEINSLPQGQETPLNQVLLQAPGVANDSYGQLHVRGDHANIQYRIDGVTLPEGITGFGQTLDTRFAKSVDLLTGAMPAQYGYREAGVVEIETKSVFENGGRIDMYGGSHDTVEPSFQIGGSEGKLNYYLTGSYLHDNLGIENPTPGANAIHDLTDQFKGFGYASYLINPTTKLSVMGGSYDGFFQVPNNPRQNPAAAPFGIGVCQFLVEAPVAPIHLSSLYAATDTASPSTRSMVSTTPAI